MSKSTFAQLGVSSPVEKALHSRGIESPFPIQSLVIPDVVAGHDVLAKSPTGSGKTVAFMAPLADRVHLGGKGFRALVLAPTRELVAQIADQSAPLARARNLAIATVYGGTSIERQTHAVRKAAIVVATPGRLEDLMARGAIRLDQVGIVVIDEADRMLDMGFRPAVDRIVAATPTDRQTLFFSATLDGAAGELSRAYTRRPRRHEHRPAEDRAGDIEHRFVPTRHADKVHTLVSELRSPDLGRTIVFVRTKHGADRLVRRLKATGLASVSIHGNKTQPQRQKALAQFASGKSATLVATDVAARGIDVDDVTHVINFDPPADRDAYIHRVGRTGRAGRTGVGITFVIVDDSAKGAGHSDGRSLEREFGGGSGASATASAAAKHGRTRTSNSRSRHARTKPATAGMSQGRGARKPGAGHGKKW